MSQVRIPIFQVLIDEDGFYYIYKFNFLVGCHIKIEGSRFVDYNTAKATADELNSEQEPIICDLEID